jgi:hypothetical protein
MHNKAWGRLHARVRIRVRFRVKYVMFDFPTHWIRIQLSILLYVHRIYICIRYMKNRLNIIVTDTFGSKSYTESYTKSYV